MNNERTGVSGSLESCDALVMVVFSPDVRGWKSKSTALQLLPFGEEMRKAVRETLESAGIFRGS